MEVVMKLSEYLESIFNDDDNVDDFPPTLELHKSTADEFALLYAGGEVSKRERGYNLSYILGWGESRIRYSHVINGLSSSIQMNHVTGDENFGNVHCHPGPSLGHIGGRAAHSPEDVLMFGTEVQKPVFIMFVAAGTSTNYAMVYRNGVTNFDRAIIVDTMHQSVEDRNRWYDRNCPAGDYMAQTQHQVDLAGARNIPDLRLAIQAASVGAKAFSPSATAISAALNGQTNQLIDAYVTYLKQQTPGFGRFMEQASIENMEWFQMAMDFGFYRTETTNASVLVRQD
jgi:hypothetical protein